MTNAIQFDLSIVQGIPDATTESGEIFLFENALGQYGGTVRERKPGPSARREQA